MPEMVVRLKISLLMLKIHGSFHLFLLIIIVIIMVKIIIIDIGSSSSMSSNSRASLERENLILLNLYSQWCRWSEMTKLVSMIHLVSAKKAT